MILALRLAKVGALLVAALLAALTFLPDERGTVLQIALVVAGGIALAGLLGALRALSPRHPSRFDEAVRRPSRPPARVAELARVEREVALATTTAGDVHYRLRPRVRTVAAHRLSARRGIDLDREVGAASVVLAPAVWELVRPDREQPSDRFAPGFRREQLRAVVDGLDSI